MDFKRKNVYQLPNFSHLTLKLPKLVLQPFKNSFECLNCQKGGYIFMHFQFFFVAVSWPRLLPTVTGPNGVKIEQTNKLKFQLIRQIPNISLIGKYSRENLLNSRNYQLLFPGPILQITQSTPIIIRFISMTFVRKNIGQK